MGMSMYLENMVHERSYAGDEAAAMLDRVVSADNDGVLLGGIHRHGDTMFNTVQLRHLCAEIDGVSKVCPGLTEDLMLFRALAGQVIKGNGYMWISGD
jgi:hypothetical protein